MRLIALLLCLTTFAANAYDFLLRSGPRWADGVIPLNLQLDETHAPFPFLDGKSSWNSVAEDAFGLWNAHLTRVQFTSFNAPGRRDGNETNEVFFADNIFGHRFGRYVLAVTTAWRVRSERVEADTVFNSAIDWNSYRGPLDVSEVDFRRVAAHEFGHALGLDHPDEAKQVRVALMNSTISDLDAVAIDDIRGARALYPPDTLHALNHSVEPAEGGSITVSPVSTNGLYPAGSIVTVTARPARRFRFNHWSGDEISSVRRVRIRIVDDTTIVASFSTNGAPRIIAQPRSQFASIFEPFTLGARTRGATNVQWFRDGSEIPEATNTTLTLTPFSHNESGLYVLRAVNSRGATPSRPARVIVDGY